ncbi:MAG TPA: PadR family transcriptional regulator [Candidatus Bathyarchaeia archaeon]|nr:PadR family transcriptional regulator [Candidatus Bathyarchaeia archaeon]
MDVKTIILGFLSEGEMSGYDIKLAFSNSIGFFYDASFGAIYPALRKLEEEGLVTKQEIIQSGKPNKILYQITDSGKELFYKEMMSPIVPPVLRSDMLVKIFFAGNRSVEEQQALLKSGLDMQKKLLDNTKKAFSKMAETLDPYQTFCWQYTMNHLEMTIKFIEDHAPTRLKQ